MARQYVLADHMFASNFDASSFISHQYIIGAQANSAVNYPRSAWGCEGGKADTIGTVSLQRTLYAGYLPTCFDNVTLGEEMDRADLPWAFYAASYTSGNYISIWSAYQANRRVYYGADWKKDVLPNTQFFDDVAHRRMRTVSWITPSCQNSDHAGLRIQHRTVVGRVAGQCGGQVPILELDRDLHPLGRLRRLVRRRSGAVRGLRWVRPAHSVAGHFAVRAKRLRLPHAVRTRQHSQVH